VLSGVSGGDLADTATSGKMEPQVAIHSGQAGGITMSTHLQNLNQT